MHKFLILKQLVQFSKEIMDHSWIKLPGTVYNVAVHNPWQQKYLFDFPSVTKFRKSNEVKCYLLKTMQLGRLGDRSNASHLSASSGRSPHFRLTPESVQTVLGRYVSLSLSGTTRPHLPTVWIIIHQTYLLYISLHTLQIILTSDVFIIIYILLFKSEI
jgi:hypothetical protein